MKIGKSAKYISLLLIITALISLQMALICGQNSDKLSISIRKNVGTAIGDKLEGDFTIHGSGDVDILALELYFNGTQVANSSSNSLEFRFNTNEYWIGDVNMTLKGYDGTGDVFLYTTIQTFLSPTVGIFIIIGVVVLIGASLGIKLVISAKNKKKSQKSSEEIKKSIRIDIDKDFQ